MKASIRWLRELLPELTATPDEIARALTGAGLEVEAIETFGEASPQILLATVVGIQPHPKRDKLRLVEVDRGAGEKQTVVCGASNVPEPGGMVCLAPVGTHLPAVDMTLEPRAIGGVPSEGMLCSERELGLRTPAGDDPGILTFEPGFAEPGTPLSSALPASHDVILEIGLTPNRPDCLGHWGIARELSALLGIAPPVLPKPSHLETREGKAEDAVAVSVADGERCPTYGAALSYAAKVAPSPLWAAYRLESLGVRSISNVVDVSNLVMLELGHPLHTFDLELVRGKRIAVRRAKAGEKLKTLDGVERELSDDDLLICDDGGGVALAGVMGGENTEIRDTTKDVLIECAYFDPRGVRRTARRHGMHTESSHRFERGVDPGDVETVLRRTQALLSEMAGAIALSGVSLTGPGVSAPAAIRLRKDRMTSLLGIEIGMDAAKQSLARLGCAIQSATDDELTVLPPSHRPDLSLEADLIEEVVRLHGMDRIPARLPAIRPAPPRSKRAVVRRVRRAAIEVGLSEALVFGFTSERELAAVSAPPPTIKLLNPLTEERTVMRTSLLPGLLEAVRRARRHGVLDQRLFATGARFLAGDDKLPREAQSFAAAIAGSHRTPLHKPVPVDVSDGKGVCVELIARALGRPASLVPMDTASPIPHLHPAASGLVEVSGKVVGHVGLLHPDAEDALDLGGPVVVVELDLEALSELGPQKPRFRPIPTLPAATRDIALVVHDDVLAGSVERAIADAAGDLCESVELFDLFRGGNVPADHRSLAFHVTYRDPKAATDPEQARTLTDKEVDKQHQSVIKTVGERFGATLRA